MNIHNAATHFHSPLQFVTITTLKSNTHLERLRLIHTQISLKKIFSTSKISTNVRKFCDESNSKIIGSQESTMENSICSTHTKKLFWTPKPITKNHNRTSLFTEKYVSRYNSNALFCSTSISNQNSKQVSLDENLKNNILEEWSEEVVQHWFLTTKYAAYANRFAKLNGKELATMSKEDFLRRSSEMGDVIYNALAERKSKTGKTWHERIVGHWNKSALKQNFFQPRQLSANSANFQRQGRYEEQKQVYEAFCKRLHARRQVPEDRLHNPIAATHGSPGSGKSFFLDTIGALNHEDLDNLCKDEEMRNILKSSVAISVTYNNATPFEIEIDGENPEQGFALRVLHSFYFTTGVSWIALAKELKGVTLEAALDCVLYAAQQQDPSKQGVVLLVDELLKSSNRDFPGNIDAVLAALGAQLNRRPSKQFNLLVSTLDTNPLIRMTTNSGRHIAWIVLNALTFEESVALFSGLPVPRGRKATLNQCISDCSGHPRSLETLKLFCEQEKWYLEPYTFLLDRFRRFRVQSSLNIPSLPHVIAALRGEEVNLDDQVPGWSGTFRAAIAAGYFLNSLNGERTVVVPKLSPFLLMCFAFASRAKCPVARCIDDMLYLEANFSWKCYEQFHAKWEVLRRLIVNTGERVSLVDYSLVQKSTSLPSFQPTQKNMVTLTHHFPGDLKTDSVTELLSNSIILPGLNNPGFDIVFRESGTVIAIECRYSNPGSKTALNLEEIETKWVLTEKEFEKHLETDTAEKPGRKGLYLIFCAWRALAQNVTKETLAQFPNCIVLGKSELINLYSPSLAARPQFIMESNQGARIPIMRGITKKQLDANYGMSELREYCKKNELGTSRAKEILIDRILMYLEK